MAAAGRSAYFFRKFHLLVEERLLLEDGRPVPLTPKAFDMLRLLVENAGRILRKDELLREIWAGTHVDESNLSQHIFWIRKALGENGDDSQFIETVPKVGYRFIAPVEKAGHEPTCAPNAVPVPEARTTPRWRPALRWVAACITAAALLGVLLVRRRPPVPPPANSGKTKLAVLPFVNLSGDASQDYFSDGFTEEMITELGRMRPAHLGVIALTTAMHYKGSRLSAAQIGRELDVDYILEGGVQREGDRLRISSHLIRVPDQTEVWAQSYNRDLGQVLALQSDVARDIAERIGPTLFGEGHNRPAAAPVNRAAYNDYLRGRYFWNKRTVEGYGKAIGYFNAGVQADPNYARNYAGLADAYALLGSMPNRVMSRKYAMSQARSAALKALELDKTLPEAYTSLAFVKMHYDWDWSGAEVEFKRAIELNPQYPTAHHWYAYYLTAVGRQDAAVNEIRQAEELDPLSAIIVNDAGDILFYAGRVDAAIAQARKALELDPNFVLAHFLLGRAYAREGQYERAIAELQKAVRLAQRHPWSLSELAIVYANSGNKSEARKLIEEILAKQEYQVAFNLASIYSAMGDKDQAFIWLERAYKERSGSLILLRVEPALEPLRSDPRFQDLVRRMAFSSGA